MSLFDSASLVITPNGVKAGKLYSIKPSDGAGDLDVVRATSATRVNANGLIEIPRTNLLLRSEEFDNAYWGLSNATILLNATNAPNGTLTADKIYPNSTGTIRGFSRNTLITLNSHAGSIFAKWDGGSIEILTLTRGSLADISFNVKTGQIVGTIPTGMTASITSFSNGWYRCSWTYNSANTLTFYQLVLSSSANSFSVTANGTDGIFIWGAQLEIGNVATEYIPTTSVIRTRFAGITQDGGSASNIPRIDYTNASCPSILVEPQRTNLLLRSEEFNDASWSKLAGASVVQNTAISPSGTLTADTLNFDAQIGSRVEQSVSLTALGTYTFSFYAKSDSVKTVGIRTGISGSPTINVEVTTEWQKFSVTQTLSVAGLAYPQIRSIDALGGSIYVWGAQLEEGSNATSYIPTVASTVTRNADVISKTGVSSLIGQTEGVLYCELNITTLGQLAQIISINTNNTGENVVSFNLESNNSMFCIVRANNVQIFNIVIPSISLGINKIAFSYKSGNTKVYINGVLRATNTSAFTFSNNFNYINVGNLQLTSRILNSTIKTIALFPTQLTDAQCISLTTL